MSTPKRILKQYWGYDAFRPMQEDIIQAVLDKNDVLALLPTGGGKSICFQVPALFMNGLCIVVSPLIALMKDQVEQLESRGINALAIYSGMPYAEIKRNLHNAAYGNFAFLYVSPERLQTSIFKEYLPALNPALVVVDEAHCISQWGYDFRPSYLQIAELREEFSDTPIIALTASATLEVQNDICDKLGFRKNQKRFQASFSRPNLRYRVHSPESKQHFISQYVASHSGSGIIYARSRKLCRQIAEWLQTQGLSANYYHAGLTHEERNERQEDWIKNKISVMVCTNAFGMGIDKPDVRYVLHHNLPENLESYYQEAGRAGRDGKDAEAILLFDERERPDMLMLTQMRYPDKDILKYAYFSLMNYLKIDAGVGEGCTRDFDMTAFATDSNMNVQEATYIIQTLEQLGVFFMSDTVMRPSLVGFITDKQTIYAYEESYPDLYQLILTLLRNYEGIFDEPVFLRESYVAKLMNSNEETVLQQLQFLHNQGVLRYRPVSLSPEITLLQNRMYKDDFYIDFRDYEERKRKHAERLQGIFNYAKSVSVCRSMMIAHYFNEQSAKPCGQCDNCKRNQTENKSSNQIDPVELMKIIQKKSMSPAQLQKENSRWNVAQLEQVIGFLMSEEKIKINEHGKLELL